LTFASGNSPTAPTIRARSPHSGARARMQRRGDRARWSFGCWTGLPATGPAGLRTWTARPTVRVRRNATAQARFRSGRRSAAHRRMVMTRLPKAHPAFSRKGMKVATFNVNGIQGRMPHLLDWLRQRRAPQHANAGGHRPHSAPAPLARRCIESLMRHRTPSLEDGQPRRKSVSS
jgi:hypothetical protein